MPSFKHRVLKDVNKSSLQSWIGYVHILAIKTFFIFHNLLIMLLVTYYFILFY